MGRAGRLFITLGLALAAAATPAAAQFSDTFTFLKAVRDADGAKTTELVDKPGMVNTRDGTTGESPLHIVVRRHDATWTQFFLAKGADPNARDRQGQTPLLIAARLTDPDIIRILVENGARVDLADSSGETPLIIAVQQRDPATVRMLLASGADPNLPDRIAGKTARDYAAADSRSSAILRLLNEAKPAAPAKSIAGPPAPR